MKKYLVVLMILALTACGHHSPTGPSKTDAAPATLKNVVVVAIQRFAEGNTVVLNLYGNIQIGMKSASDPYGANIRLRVYDGSTFKTYITGYANSAPIVDVNDTIIRDIATPGKIDFELFLEPYGCKTPDCWISFTFPDKSHTVLKPENQFRVTEVNGGVHITGQLPAVGQ